MECIVKKLGGENAAELHKSAKNIYDDYQVWKNQVVVVSAMRSSNFNTTDKLILIGKKLSEKKINTQELFKIIQELEDFHLGILEEKLLCGKEKLIKIIKAEFSLLRDIIYNFLQDTHDQKIIPEQRNDYSIMLETGEVISILWFGERVCCRIFSGVIDSLSDEKICSKSIDLSCLVEARELRKKSEIAIFDILSQKLSSLILKNIEQGNIPVLSGYIGTFENGIEQVIWRWYSDATAAVCTVWLARRGNTVVLEIQKSVPGLMSADPRVLDNPQDAKVIQYLDYLTAREITGDCWAQAKLLHHQTLRNEVQESWVRIHLFDPFSPVSNGSWIESELQAFDSQKSSTWVEFIGGRNNMIFFSISSGKMFENGILARLFTIVQKYVSVDIISASETEITFTIDGNHQSERELQKMTEEIREDFKLLDDTSMEFVEYTKNKSLIFCVGQHMRNHTGLMSRAVGVLGENNINIEIASQGRLQRAMVFGIDEKDMRKAINILHQEFITS